MTDKVSGTVPFMFKVRHDLDNLPESIREHELGFHTMFTEDQQTGDLYYALQGVGVIRLSADMQNHEVIPTPDALKSINIHSVVLATLNNEKRLFLTANDYQQVIVMKLNGEVDFSLERPKLMPYQSDEAPYKPTDTVVVGNKLYIADGYGHQIISVVDLHTRTWVDYFGGKTESHTENGKFRTAHNITLTPDGQNLMIVDRWNSRLQVHAFDGSYTSSHRLPYNAWLCSIDFIEWHGKHCGVIACLYDVDEDNKNPAPIYIVDGETFDIMSTIYPQVDLGIPQAQCIHNAVWHVHDKQLYLICHSWNPGKYFVLEHVVD